MNTQTCRLHSLLGQIATSKMVAARTKPDDIARRIIRPAPRGQQIKQYVLQKMIQGEWPPNHRVPSEFELVKQFDCSRMTVHHALKQLRDEGYLMRVPGLGTFIARPNAHLAVFKLSDIAIDLELAGRQHSLKVITKKEKRANRNEAREFGISQGERLFLSVVLHLADGKPVQLERRIVNAQAVPDYLQYDFTKQTPFSVMMDRMPYPEGKITVSAVVPALAERKLLGLRSANACIEVDRVTWSRSVVYNRARVLMVEPSALVAMITPPNGGPLG